MTYKLAKTSRDADPYFGAVSLLLDGTDLQDKSLDTKAITVNGDAQVSTAQSKWNGSSLYFDGSGDYLTANSGDFAFGTADFTVELYGYAAAPHVDYRALVTTRPNNSGHSDAFHLGVRANGILVLYSNTFHISSSANAMPVGQWCHIALVRYSGIATIYVNGVSVGTGSFANNVTKTVLGIGDFPVTQAEPFNGYIDDIRLTKGVARYTANFTPPTQPFFGAINPDQDRYFYATSLLLHGDGTNGSTNIVDSSGDPKTITVNGDAQISTAQSKFGGSSLAFDGSGDYLSIPNSTDFDFGSGEFTIEFWVNTTTTIVRGIASKRTSGGASNSNWIVYVTAAGALQFYASDGSTYQINGISGGTINDGSWHHCAVVRNGNTFTLYVNGVSVASQTTSFTISSTSRPFYIGVDHPGNSTDILGYIDDLRITKGVARYTSNFTPPTKAFPDY